MPSPSRPEAPSDGRPAASRPPPRGPFGVSAHPRGTPLAQKYPATGDLPYERPTSRDRRPAVGSGNAPRAAILEWRERVAHLPTITALRIAPRRNHMKHDLKARLFGLAVTLAFFGFVFLPAYGSRW